MTPAPQSSSSNTRTPAPQTRTARIYTMPEKFYVEEGKRNAQRSPLRMILVFVLVLIVLGGGGFLVYQQMQKPDGTEQTNNSLIGVINTNTAVNNTNTSTNATLNSNTILNTNRLTNGFVNVNSVQTNSVFTNTNSAVNTNTSTVLDSEDSDSDSLTNVEEALYGTSLSVADTDGDSFADGQEVLNGYDPNAATARLSSNSGVQVHSNSTDGYSLWYPRSWAVANDPQNTRGKLFSTSGEFISVSVQDNPAQLSARDWYLTKAPGVNPSSISSVTNWDRTLTGVKSVDGMTVYFTRGTFAYVVSYNTNILSQANFRTTFAMMYQSLTILSTPTNTNKATTNSNTNANSNTNSQSNSNQL
ncbi:MAG: hypothetical protein HZC01_03610 [Candidatus Kerfeldbacteria bacterium]|nr:hypothetical protein [Candidatus Kerfeldbacteria bacterium]